MMNIAKTAVEEYNSGKLSQEFLIFLMQTVDGDQLEEIWSALPAKLQNMEESQKKYYNNILQMLVYIILEWGI